MSGPEIPPLAPHPSSNTAHGPKPQAPKPPGTPVGPIPHEPDRLGLPSFTKISIGSTSFEHSQLASRLYASDSDCLASTCRRHARPESAVGNRHHSFFKAWSVKILRHEADIRQRWRYALASRAYAKEIARLRRYNVEALTCADFCMGLGNHLRCHDSLPYGGVLNPGMFTKICQDAPLGRAGRNDSP